MEEHNDLVKRASLWHPVDVAAMDILAGPAGEDAVKVGGEVKCTFAELDPAHPITGHSKKFRCTDEHGHLLKVKYDPQEDREVFSEVAATRLFWALGFYAERVYSVKAVVTNAPKDPWKSYDPPRAARVFEPAAINKRLKGEPVYFNEEEGWNLTELDNVDSRAGGSSDAAIDALKILIAFVNHGDNTPNQQRLLCAEDDKACAHPLMFVTDLGGTFGGRDYATAYRAWAKKEKLWKDPAKCVLDFVGTHQAFRDPQVGEAGRKFLADLIGKLSDKQIHDLFAAGRYDLLGKLDFPVVGKDGTSHPASLDDWAALFKKKRQQILDAHCPK